MKVFVLALFLVETLALKEASFEATTIEQEEPTGYNYHEKFGIKAAARRKAMEEALDFNGSRITGGHVALNGDVPYMGGVAVMLTTGITSICGSSLVSNTKLVTAAHCWWDGRNQAHLFTIVLGWFLIYIGGTRIPTRDVVTHPSWNPATGQNDIAIITIRWVDYNDFIKPIDLPSESLLERNFAGEFAQAAGYGMISDHTHIGTNPYLFYVNLQILTNSFCSQYYSNLVDSMMCTSGAGAQSVCRGDMGGPLAYNDNGREVLIGAASFVSQYGCTVGRPAVFTRVGPYVEWIRSQM